jgi:SAM-dependent methyltransferase
VSRYSPAWLGLREPADAAARAAELLDQLPVRDRWEVRDLGCGTGAMARWLAGRLPGPQHWVLYDRDPALLDHAAATAASTAADGAQVTVEPRQREVTALSAGELAGAGLVTASALLDLLTREEVDRLAAACVEAGCLALLTLSVVGQVELSPADPLDEEVAAAFNAHQRRRVDGRRLLGPDAVDAAAEAFTRHGATVQVRPSPWRLGPAHAELLREWLRGWVAAAYEQRPALGARDGGYLERRLAAAAAGELRAVVGHRDLLATSGMNRRHPTARTSQR